ncbi:MAG TPA: aminotransferase class IV [Eoetvoesiella sp.]
MNTPPVQLIETMRVEPGNTLPLLDWHLQRLQRSCAQLGFVWPGDPLVRAIARDASVLSPDNTYRLRLLLDADGQYRLEADPLPATPAPVLIRLNSTPIKTEPFQLQHKTTRRPWYDKASAWLAQNNSFFDIVFCNQQNEVCEGSRTNVYILNSAGVWVTPPLQCGLLPGVQRQALIDSKAVEVAVITRDEFINAKAIRVSNALRGWLAAVLFADQP